MKIRFTNGDYGMSYLDFYGYENPVSLGNGVYDVDALGIQTPEISLIDSSNLKYRDIIKQVREDKGLSVEALANIMLITPGKLQSVENGTGWFTNNEINLCANVLGLSASAMMNGEIRPRITTQSLQQDLDQFIASYHAAQESQVYMLDTLQQLNPPERYRAQYNDKPVENISGYAVFDCLKNELVKNQDGTIMQFTTAKEALETARMMDKEYIDGKKHDLENISSNFIQNEDDVTNEMEETKPKL